MASCSAGSTSGKSVKEWSLDTPLRQRSWHYCPCSMGCSASGVIGLDGVCSSDNTQSNIWDQVEQKNAKLVQPHPNVVQGIKLLD